MIENGATGTEFAMIRGMREVTSNDSEGAMITVDEREIIRRAYFVEQKSIRQIARELKHSRVTIEKAIDKAESPGYKLTAGRSAPVLGAYKAMIEELLVENKKLPRKQRYTAHKIFKAIQAKGYPGAESTVRGYISAWRGEHKRPATFLPLEFDAGRDAQVDWGEAAVIMNGEQITVQVFTMRLNYSRKCFVRAYPRQNQESFLDAHVQAFHFLGGVPQRLSYDNLKAAVLRILQGHKRDEQRSFTTFRSHYLFESHFCTPGEGHEKGGVEHAVGYGRRNFMVPLPKVSSFEELNNLLLAECRAEDSRQVKGQPLTIGEAWEQERSALHALPTHDLECCTTVPVVLTPYSQATFETNRYSVPVDESYRNLIVKAYPFRIDILHLDKVIARHARCYAREQDVYDPLHYLTLLEQRPGAFEHAKPMRQWRSQWPAVYETFLAKLKERLSDGQEIREFVKVLKLHRDYPMTLVEQAMRTALGFGCIHADGVTLCLHRLAHPDTAPPTIDLSNQPHLQQIHTQGVDLGLYDQLLQGGR